MICDCRHNRHSITTFYHYAECRVLFGVVLSVVMLGVIMLSAECLSWQSLKAYSIACKQGILLRLWGDFWL
jgi:hypothetical protein